MEDRKVGLQLPRLRVQRRHGLGQVYCAEKVPDRRHLVAENGLVELHDDVAHCRGRVQAAHGLEVSHPNDGRGVENVVHGVHGA